MSSMTKSAIEKRINKMRELLQIEAESWRDLLSDMQSYFDEKSENWQTGDKGDEYQDWLNAVEEQVDRLDESADFSLN